MNMAFGNIIRKTGREALLAILAAAAGTSSAPPTVTIDSVVQRWPWNNKADITYTVADGEDAANSIFYRLVFTTVIDGQTYTIDGATNVGARVTSGQHTVTWTLPGGVRCEDCTMSAAIYPSDFPSGDDYMVVNLTNGVVRYEGLLASQAASNARYNTDAYKEHLLVLRKVPAGGPYRTGSDSISDNPKTNWTTRLDYYAGIFLVTQRQYELVTGANPCPGKFSQDCAENPAWHRPATHVDWNTLRASAAPDEEIPVVTSPGTGSFIQRLKYLTGGRFAFDLPTEVMWEIAARGGKNNWEYIWSNNYYQYTVTNNVYYYEKNNYASHGPNTRCAGLDNQQVTWFVGRKKPNSWGLYDVVGNAYEMCRDDNSLAILSDAADPFTPASGGSGNIRLKGSPNWIIEGGEGSFRPAWRSNAAKSRVWDQLSFRLFVVMP